MFVRPRLSRIRLKSRENFKEHDTRWRMIWRFQKQPSRAAIDIFFYYGKLNFRFFSKSAFSLYAAKLVIIILSKNCVYISKMISIQLSHPTHWVSNLRESNTSYPLVCTHTFASQGVKKFSTYLRTYVLNWYSLW